jgi:hypothetical protein
MMVYLSLTENRRYFENVGQATVPAITRICLGTLSGGAVAAPTVIGGRD